ncbi:glycoside hydrolase family protein [Maricaulis maris]|uniref:glycoside hydrolase family protein n=1 Tax=Maricaulis maris TaxID=74318 RepID=UPI003A91014C
MHVSKKGLGFIAGHEGFVSRGYLDPAGVVTIGFGFTMRSNVFRAWWMKAKGRPLKVGDPMSKTDARQILATLLEHEYGPPVAACFGKLRQPQFDACVSAVYNLGPGCLKWRWARALKAGDVAGAARLLARSGTTAGGRRLAGLVRRRREEAALLLTGAYKGAAPLPEDPDPALAEVQKQLVRLGYDTGAADGRLGPKTRVAIRAFQRDHPPLKRDGIAGPATLSAMRRALEKRQAAGALGLGGGGAALTALASGFPWPLALIIAAGLLAIGGVAFCLWHCRGRLRAAF